MKTTIMEAGKHKWIEPSSAWAFTIGVREAVFEGATIRSDRWLNRLQQRAWEEGMKVGQELVSLREESRRAKTRRARKRATTKRKGIFERRRQS